MTQEQNSALQNLEYIKQIMTDTRRAIDDKGIVAIVWGIMIALGQVGNFILVRTHADGVYYLWMWGAIIGSAWLGTIIDSRKNYSRSANTFAEKILSALWISFGVTMTIIGFAGSMSGLIHGMAINPLVATILGGIYFVAGLLYGKKWFRSLAFGWWSGAIVMFFYHSEITFLIMGAMMILFQTLPGILFYQSYKASRGA